MVLGHRRRCAASERLGGPVGLEQAAGPALRDGGRRRRPIRRPRRLLLRRRFGWPRRILLCRVPQVEKFAPPMFSCIRLCRIFDYLMFYKFYYVGVKRTCSKLVTDLDMVIKKPFFPSWYVVIGSLV